MFEAPGASEGGGSHAGGQDMVRLVRQLMRGRLTLALTLAALLGLGGAAAGFSQAQPVYRSRGIVQIMPTVPEVLYKTPENELLPFFASFVSAQATLLESSRVLELARMDMAKAGEDRVKNAADARVLRDGVRVSNRQGEQIILVDFIHADPVSAQAAVNAILASYQRVYDEESGRFVSGREQILTDRETSLQRDIESLKSVIEMASDQYGTMNLESLLQQRFQEQATLTSRIRDVDERVSLIEAQRANQPDAPDSPRSVDDMDDAALGQLDQALAMLIARRDNIQSRIDARSPFLGPEHFEMKALGRDLDEVNAQITSRARDVRHALANGQLEQVDFNAGMIGDLATLREMRQRFERQLTQSQEQSKQMERTLRLIAQRREDLNEKKALLADTTRALEAIRVENDTIKAGRVKIAQRGDRPLRPYADKRFALAVMGGAGGAAVGLGLVVVWALMHRKYRYIDELEGPTFTAPLLGSLPDLSSASAEREEMTAWSIHQIRNLLQMRVAERPGRGSMFMVTSPQAGDGKTSLSLALAISFANSGKRTLLMDIDLVGRGLSAQLGLAGAPGLCEAIVEHRLNGEVHATAVPGLHVVPAGVVGEVDETKLSRSKLSEILEPMRASYEAIVIDTGPVLGSLEASMLCSIVDGVLVTISRGQDAKLVETAIQRVRWLGAEHVGLVFNRASVRDLQRSHSQSGSASLRSQRTRPTGGQRRKPQPLLRALGSAVPDQIVEDHPAP